MFKVGAKIGAGLVCAAIIALLSGGPGLAQEKDPSDNSVRMFMTYAWQLLPEKFTSPSGKTIVVDKSKPKSVEVPFEVSREAVRVGYYSAHAQICNLLEEQQANYRTLMARHRDDKWSDQQQLYIQKLHQATVMIMTGKITFVEAQEGKLKPVQREAKTNPKYECNDAKRQMVKAQIAAYINAAPATRAKTAEPAKAKTVEPAKASTQKK